MAKTAKILEEIYERLFEEFGPQHWWPAKTPFEVIIGSILTQNTAWSNVEKAIKNLKKENILSPPALKKIPLGRLAKLIRSSGYYNQKAKKIKNFVNFLYSRYDGSLLKMFKKDYLELRSELLTIKGIGLETADSILLYAAGKPIFVVDAYTKRILLRHNILSGDENYSAIQNIFMDSLKEDAQLFNEYHALLVKLGKSICKTKPNCLICPLNYLFEKKGAFVCDSCNKELTQKEARYLANIELYASPDIEFSDEDLRKDSKKELKSLIEELKKCDSEELEEDVYISYKFNLCKRCRDIFNQRLNNKEFV